VVSLTAARSKNAENQTGAKKKGSLNNRVGLERQKKRYADGSIICIAFSFSRLPGRSHILLVLPYGSLSKGRGLFLFLENAKMLKRKARIMIYFLCC